MLKVIKGGVQAVVEDWPGRVGYLDNGMASSGAFDPVALGLANVCVGNAPGEAGIEIAGGYFEGEFADDAVFALGGTDMSVTVNGQPVSNYEAVKAAKGDQIKFSHFGDGGFRCYLAIAGGVDVPAYLGSKSTCVFGSYGGFEGRPLAPGDEIKVGKPSASLDGSGWPQDQGRQAAHTRARLQAARYARPELGCRTTSPKRAWSTSSATPSRRS